MFHGTKQHHWSWPLPTEPCPFPHCHLLLALSSSCHGFHVEDGKGPPLGDTFMESMCLAWQARCHRQVSGVGEWTKAGLQETDLHHKCLCVVRWVRPKGPRVDKKESYSAYFQTYQSLFTLLNTSHYPYRSTCCSTKPPWLGQLREGRCTRDGKQLSRRKSEK